jgi:hypothetical protein
VYGGEMISFTDFTLQLHSYLTRIVQLTFVAGTTNAQAFPYEESYFISGCLKFRTGWCFVSFLADKTRIFTFDLCARITFSVTCDTVFGFWGYGWYFETDLKVWYTRIYQLEFFRTPTECVLKLIRLEGPMLGSCRS